jgi:hypothetical protein
MRASPTATKEKREDIPGAAGCAQRTRMRERVIRTSGKAFLRIMVSSMRTRFR